MFQNDLDGSPCMYQPTPRNKSCSELLNVFSVYTSPLYSCYSRQDWLAPSWDHYSMCFHIDLLMIRWLKKHHWEQTPPHPHPFVRDHGMMWLHWSPSWMQNLRKRWETFRKPLGNELPKGGFPKSFLLCFRRVSEGFPDFLPPDWATLGKPCEGFFGH